jgi:hypothetical protein
MLNPFYDNYPNRIIHLEKLCKKYDVKKIWITYKDSNRKEKLLQIEPTIDLLVKLHVWIAYNTETNHYEISQNQINKRNHWLSTLESDVTNNRINLKDYLYEYKKQTNI